METATTSKSYSCSVFPKAVVLSGMLYLQPVFLVRRGTVSVIDGGWTLVPMPESLPDQLVSVLGSCTRGQPIGWPCIRDCLMTGVTGDGSIENQ